MGSRFGQVLGRFRRILEGKPGGEKSRKILKDRGYLLVFSDVKHHVINNGSFEDWYVHPDLVDNNLEFSLSDLVSLTSINLNLTKLLLRFILFRISTPEI